MRCERVMCNSAMRQSLCTGAYSRLPLRLLLVARLTASIKRS